MNLPTDTELEKRAKELTNIRYPNLRYSGSAVFIAELEGFQSATLEALKIERESYRLLMECRDAMVSNDVHGWAFELTDHLTTLRTRLGITE